MIAPARSILALLALGVSAGAAPAQESSSPIATDRPGFAFNTGVVGRGVTQVELGLPSVTEVDSGGTTTRLVSAVGLLRVGVSPRWEIRLGAPMYNWVRGGGSDASGWGDLELGAKAHVLDGSGGVPKTCLIPSVILPAGDAGFSAEKARATLGATFEWITKSGWSLKDLTGVAYLGLPGSDRHAQLTEAVCAGRSIGSSKWSAYVEAGAIDTTIDHAGTAAYLGGGLAVLPTNDVQIDLWFNRGLTDDAADWLYGFGVSARF